MIKQLSTINQSTINQSTINIIKIIGVIILMGFLTSGCNRAKDGTDPWSKINNGDNIWKTIGYGGGGAMFYPAISPHNADYVYVACDMTGAYVTYNGGESWRMFSLRGPVKYFVFDPVDSDVVYAKSIALFKSNDRGHSWNVIYPAPSEITGFISRGDHAEEVIITRDSTSRQVLALAVDPANSQNLHAAISIDDSVSYYFSDDQGQNWIKEQDLPDGAKNIFIVPSSHEENRTIIITGTNSISVRENSLWKINNGPENVKKLNKYSGGYDKSQDKFIIYAISGESYFNSESDSSGIYYTEDLGQTWENRQDGITGLAIEDSDIPEWRTIATSSLNPGFVYISYAGLKVHEDTTCIGVARSEDFGVTWKLVWKDRITKDRGIYSPNYTKGWIDERFNPTWGENPFSIAVSAADPDVCYTTDFGRTIKTSNGGITWEQVYTGKKTGGGWISRGLDVTTGYSVVFDPFDTSHVFITNTDIGLMESKDGGESWISATVNNGIPKKWVNSTYWMTFDPAVRGRAWAAMSSIHDLPRPKMWKRVPVNKFTGGLLVTEDGGRTWNEISRDIGEAAFTHILIDKASGTESRTLYACAFGKGVYKSVDGGISWKQKNKGLRGTEPFAWRIVKNDKTGTLYLTVIRRSDDGSIGNEMDGAIYRSDNWAESWVRMPLPKGTNGPTSISFDPENSSRLLMSAWGRPGKDRFSNDTGGGIFLSEDNGATWKNVLEKDQHIHDITYDPVTYTWYACGFNGSAYRSENGQNWYRLKGYNFKWGKRVDPDPRDPEKIFVVTFGGGVFYGPARGDENATDDIVTPVLARE